MGKFIDLTGRTINNFLVLGLGYNKTWKCGQLNTRWRCLCIACGYEMLVPADSLRLGRDSCGCRNRVDSSLNAKYKDYKGGAKQRGFSFNLSKEEFRKLVAGNCYYCNVKPSQIFVWKGGRGKKNPPPLVYNGIDRLDSSKNYNSSNCVSCCADCNHAKLALSEEEFYKLVERIYLYQRTKGKI